MSTIGKRYVRLGTAVPKIYPGTPEGLVQAVRDTKRASELQPGRHRLAAHEPPGKMTTFRVFEGGEEIGVYADGEVMR